MHKMLRWSTGFAFFLALIVVMLGAYTRLTDAGLGCPDWPGCYGRLMLPKTQVGLEALQAHFPDMPIETQKAWTEMIHRYLAGVLGLLILFIGGSLIYKRREHRFGFLPLLVLFLLIFQAGLGMWTVTLKLLPVVVMGHLLGGMLIVACLARLFIAMSDLKGEDLTVWRPWFRLGFFIVLLQIALGGWLTSNYAGIGCVGFPKCNGLWLPDLHLAKGFNLFSMPGVNYQGGLLENDVRMTIAFIHRVGAVLTATYLLTLAGLVLLKLRGKYIRRAAGIMAALLVLQFLLGIINVLYLLPLPVAVAHNGVAALLLATVFSVLHFTRRKNNELH